MNRSAATLLKCQRKAFPFCNRRNAGGCNKKKILQSSRPFTCSRIIQSSSSSSSSVSNDEVSKFSSMASTWWEPDLNPLISMNPTRMEFIIQTLQTNNRLHSNSSANSNDDSTYQQQYQYPYQYQPLKGLKALDVGCGGGLLSESLARLGANVTAIDPSEQVANAAYEHSKLDPMLSSTSSSSSSSSLSMSGSNSITYRGGMSVEELAMEYQQKSSNENDNDNTNNDDDDDLFDIVCILEVIEHATNPNSLIQSATSLLKKKNNNGMLFVSTINRTMKSYGIAIVGGEYVTGKLPIGTHDWNQFKSPSEIRSLVGSTYSSSDGGDGGGNGLVEVSRKGMVLKPPFYDLRWELSDSDMDVNWIGAYSS